ncbi:MAG: hypothetical protein ACOXZS_05065 [Bacilli bacterium]|jgi:hypothetical protein|nr:hypothetical protein [Bacilli bacterium]
MKRDKLILFHSTKNDGNMSDKYDNNNTASINRKEFFENANIDINRIIRIEIQCKDEVSMIDNNYIITI